MSRRDMLRVWEVGYWPRVVLGRHGLGMIIEVTVEELIQHSTRRICFRTSTVTKGRPSFSCMHTYIFQAYGIDRTIERGYEKML